MSVEAGRDWADAESAKLRSMLRRRCSHPHRPHRRRRASSSPSPSKAASRSGAICRIDARAFSASEITPDAFTEKAWEALQGASQAAQARRGGVVEPEDLLVAMLKQDSNGLLNRALRLCEPPADEKVLRRLADDRRRARDEALILQSVHDHPFMVTMHSAFEDESCFHCELQHAPHGPLSQWLDAGPFSEGAARLVAACLTRVAQVNDCSRSPVLVPFLVDNERVGAVPPEVVEALRSWPAVFECLDPSRVSLSPELAEATLEQRRRLFLGE